MNRRYPTLFGFCSNSRHELVKQFVLCLSTSILFALAPALLLAQNDYKQFDSRAIYDQLDAQTSGDSQRLVAPWWDSHVTNSLRRQDPMPTDIHTILYLAVHNSKTIKVAKRDPLIRETAIIEADSNFDWVRFLDTAWNDFSQPVSTILDAGGTATRLNDTNFLLNGGLRKRTRYGGQLNIGQRFGWQDTNSQFFTPADQATSQLTLSYTHPLLRGRGFAFNNSIVFLAQIDSEVAQQEFLAVLQDELLEIVRGYWSLYQERAYLAQQMRLFLKTQEIYEALNARQAVDAQRTQLITSASALESRRADLIRARTSVTNAETRLRGMLNAPELSNSDILELIPSQVPVVDYYPADLQTEIQAAIQNRPEALAAIQQVKAGSTRLGVAENELLPALNLVTETFANGLRGNSEFRGAFSDQFSVGRPSYSIGLQYELPVGNRLARARVCRRKHELEQLTDQYGRALEIIQTEVDIAVRELQTAYQEIGAKSRALAAAESEAETIRQRWKKMVDGNGTASLNLESLLRAMERVTEAEREYVTSILTYNLAAVNLKRANGTLLQSENVTINRSCEDGCKQIQLDKDLPPGSAATMPFDPGSTISVEPASSLPVETYGGVSPAVVVPRSNSGF